MPTVEQLQPAIVAADDDVLPVSQSGTMRRVTRSQLLAGMQAKLVLTPGLLGRTSPGMGPPQPISIGQGLVLTDGVLSGSPRFSTTTLPASDVISLSDAIPIARNGQDRAISIKTLLSVDGIEVSGQLARAEIGVPRTIQAWLDDAITVEAFGAVGDGAVDDAEALRLAIASGRPVLLGPKTYRIDGQFNIQIAAVLLGVPGRTILRRNTQSGGAWIAIAGPRFTARDVIFDAGSVDGESWGVLVDIECEQTSFNGCSFLNATGSTLGTGLTIQARDKLNEVGSVHRIENCRFTNNACHGLWIQASSGATVNDCVAADNGHYGICFDFNDETFKYKVQHGSIRSCRCSGNRRGISVGNYNETNQEPPRWGLGNPDAIDISVLNNICLNNSDYGIAVSGLRIQVVQNHIAIKEGAENASGILCNTGFTSLEDNSIVGPGSYGIDAGGCSNLSIARNLIQDCLVGVNAGGGNNIRLINNRLYNNRRAITIFQVETDGKGKNFGLACSDVLIEANLLQVGARAGGIFLIDDPERINVSGNQFYSDIADLPNLLCSHTASCSVQANIWNGDYLPLAMAKIDGNSTRLIVSEILDSVRLPVSVTKINSLIGSYELSMIGAISFIRVVAGGHDYSSAEIAIVGSGSGAAATAYIHDGVIIGIAMLTYGVGYDSNSVSVQISGNGQEAVAQAFVGIPPALYRRLTLKSINKFEFPSSILHSRQASMTDTLAVFNNTDLTLESSTSGWAATDFNSADCILNDDSGKVSLKATKGDIEVKPGIDGVLRVCSDKEPFGFITCFGRDSPEGKVAAPPGSDYRNLSGGVGQTLWIKRAGVDTSGWFPIA